MSRLIDADALIKALRLEYPMMPMFKENQKEWAIKTDGYRKAEEVIRNAPTIDAVSEWMPCSERLPKIGERVLLATNCGTVVIGHRDKPDLIWQVTEKGDKHWVYDPEAYTDDIDSLPKGEDCGFSQDTDYADGFLSVTSLNYNPRFEGVIAWMPLPNPYGERKESE